MPKLVFDEIWDAVAQQTMETAIQHPSETLDEWYYRLRRHDAVMHPEAETIKVAGGLAKR